MHCYDVLKLNYYPVLLEDLLFNKSINLYLYALFLTGISWSFTQTTQQQKWLHELHILLCAYTVDTVEKNTFLTLTKIKIPLIR